MEELGRLPLLSRERDFSRSSISWLQLVLYVQASEFACLPGRSYRCKFPCRAAEAFTSELNVHRYLCTHRICYPPDYRQLAERGLSPRKIHSIVDCSSSLPQSSLAIFAEKSSERARKIFVRKVCKSVRQVSPGNEDFSELMLCVATIGMHFACRDSLRNFSSPVGSFSPKV